MNNLIIELKQFANDNLKIIQHPSQNKEFTLTNLNELCDLLIMFLNYEADEPSLARVKENFAIHFQKIQELNLNELANAIEGLATNFEPFLKKIGFIKFPEVENWNGDSIYSGINKTTLNDLLNSQFSFKDYRNINDDPQRDFSEKIINYTGINRAILDFVKQSLRNAVHEAKNYNRLQLIQYSNYVIAIYLFAINDNKSFLKKFLFPEYYYLEKITGNKNLIHLNSIYIELFGKEDEVIIDSIGIEKIDGDKLIAMIDNYNIDNYNLEDKAIEFENINQTRVDTINNISKDTNKFVVIGEPGAGKTTCLTKIQYDNAFGIINGIEKSKFPLFIKASSYSQSNTFDNIISNEISFTTLNKLIIKYNVLILIDGLNEIDEQYKISAFNELKSFINKHQDISLIISTRKHGFIDQWNLPVFELKNLNSKQIEQFILKIIGKEKGEPLWKEINNNPHILELSQNPLMLMMILQVTKVNKGLIPKNKGLLYKLFNDGIFAREKRIYSTDIETKRDILSYLAFWMREKGLFKRINKQKCKSILQSQLKSINTSIGVNSLINEFIDNHFLKDENDELEFYHETQQEYFVAIELKNQFLSNNHFSIDYSDEKWFEPILICNDLFNNEVDRMRLFEYLYIGTKLSTTKPLDKFNELDINPNFIIASKVAFSTKFTYPEIYKKAEDYLGNYLILWSYCQSFKDNIALFTNILKAIASLSSDVLFYKILNLLKYAYIWLYDPEYEITHTEIINYAENNFKSKFELFSRTFIENLSDFTTFYYFLISENLSDSNIIYSRSIKHYKLKLKSYALHDIATNQLISTFYQIKNVELLKVIGKSDFDFLIENYHLVENFTVNDLYNTIANYHIKNTKAIEYIKKTIRDVEIGFKLRIDIYIELLNFPDLLEFILLDIYTISTNSIYEEDLLKHSKKIRKLLKNIPLSLLNKYNISNFFTIPIISFKEINFKILQQNSYNLVFIVPFDDASTFVIKNNTINFLINDNFEKCEVESIVDTSIENINGYTVVKCHLGNNFAENINSIKLLKVEIDFNTPSLYHSDTFINNTILLRYIESQIYSKNIRNFVNVIGIESYFLKYFELIDYSIVLRVNKHSNSYLIYNNVANKVVNISTYHPLPEIKSNDIVFVESNFRIVKLSKSIIDKIVFIKSYIIDYDIEKKDGFIKDNNPIKDAYGDFYFSSENCDFQPKLGDEVLFLQGLNFYKKYNLKPAAYCISKIPDKIAVIKTIVEQSDYFNLYLVDKDSEAQYFSRIYKKDCEKLKINIQIHRGMEFKFKIAKNQKEGSRKKIHLLERIENEVE